MKKLALIALCCLAFLAARPQDVTTAVSVWQDGVERSDRTVAAKQPFSLVGSGFDPSGPAKVCLTGQPCVRVPTDASGGFSWTLTLYYVGTYTVHVYQGTSPDDPPLQYEGSLTVVD